MKPDKPEGQEGPGWRWVKVSDALLEEMKTYSDPMRVKVEKGTEEGEVIITFQVVPQG